MMLWILLVIGLVSSCTCQHNPGHHEDECDICTDDFEGFGMPASRCGCCPWPCCCKCFNITTGPAGECQALIDLLCIMDSSGSIGSADWEVAKQFITDVVGIFTNIGKDQLVAKVTYSTNATVHWDFNDARGLNKAALEAAVMALPLKGMFTNTVEAMEKAVTQVLTPAGGDRPGVPNVCLIITDGRANFRIKQMEEWARKLQAACDKVIAVGVTEEIGMKELELLTGDADNVFRVTDFNALKNILLALQEKICPERPVEEKCFCCCTPEQFFGGGGAYYYMH